MGAMEQSSPTRRDGATRLPSGELERTPPGKREEYVAPCLTVYGSVRNMTLTAGNRGRKDAKRSRRKTGFR